MGHVDVPKLPDQIGARRGSFGAAVAAGSTHPATGGSRLGLRAERTASSPRMPPPSSAATTDRGQTCLVGQDPPRPRVCPWFPGPYSHPRLLSTTPFHQWGFVGPSSAVQDTSTTPHYRPLPSKGASGYRSGGRMITVPWSTSTSHVSQHPCDSISFSTQQVCYNCHFLGCDPNVCWTPQLACLWFILELQEQ